jgi:hypothetical protein
LALQPYLYRVPNSVLTCERKVIVKDKLLAPETESGREQATISYEADFTVPPETIPGDSHNRSIIIPFASLNATYRGKLQKDAPKLNKKHVKQISLMMRRSVTEGGVAVQQPADELSASSVRRRVTSRYH